MSREEDDKLIDANTAVFDMKHVLYKDQLAKDNIWVIAGEGTTMQRAHQKENYE